MSRLIELPPVKPRPIEVRGNKKGRLTITKCLKAIEAIEALLATPEGKEKRFGLEAALVDCEDLLDEAWRQAGE